MTPFISALGRDQLLFWRLDRKQHAPTWDSGEGAYRVGGRWNSPGERCVYCSLDASTAILEMAVHVGFTALNAQSHVLTRVRITDPATLFICQRTDLPNTHWLVPGATSRAQRAFGDALLGQHQFIALPSVVAPQSWNLIFAPAQVAGAYVVEEQVPLALDPRLDPPRSRT
ncbi:MAG TPA: RES domain-containing protein [Polyangiaceae bacterium]|nr:RES domain-containing protein [Polyangiaceae bacterium]